MPGKWNRELFEEFDLFLSFLSSCKNGFLKSKYVVIAKSETVNVPISDIINIKNFL